MMEFLKNKKCQCGKIHNFSSIVISGEVTINKLPEILREHNIKKVFIVEDKNTFKAAGEMVEKLLKEENFETSKYIFLSDKLEPDENAVGLAFMNFDFLSDAIIGIGSGVINDICKIISNVSNKKYILVATAPSMDGFVSSTSSMTVSGFKKSLQSKCADVVIGDTNILCKAPVKLMVSGIGDMIAKYVSICEWRISHLINGEYYCEEIAELVRASLKKCVDNVDGVLTRDKKAIGNIFEGLVMSGVAMNYAGISRPASGVEHYFSHIWDMRGAAFKTPCDLHGIQCAIGTLIAIRIYEKLYNYVPDKTKAVKYVENFDKEKWFKELPKFVGKDAEEMVQFEEKEQKYNVKKHAERIDTIINNWDKILKIIKEELPYSKEIENLLKKLNAPLKPSDIGIEDSIISRTFKTTKDIRDKYILSSLCFDLGILDEIV